MKQAVEHPWAWLPKQRKTAARTIVRAAVNIYYLVDSQPNNYLLVVELGLDELAVEAGDVGDRLILRALSLAGTGVGAVSEAQFLHLGHHGLGTLGSLGTALGQQGELAHLTGDEEHGRAVLAGSHTGSASDAGGAVHGLVGILLRDEDGIGILGLASAHRSITTGSDDLVEGRAVDHAVLDHGEGSRAPGLNGDDVTVVEAAHIELAGCGSLCGTVGMAVDIKRAHTADTLAAVVVEDKRLLTALDELLVENVEHFEE